MNWQVTNDPLYHGSVEAPCTFTKHLPVDLWHKHTPNIVSRASAQKMLKYATDQHPNRGVSARSFCFWNKVELRKIYQ